VPFRALLLLPTVLRDRRESWYLASSDASARGEACRYREITVFTRVLTVGNVAIASRPPGLHPVHGSSFLALKGRPAGGEES